MIYIEEGIKFSLSYSDLRNKFREAREFSDEEFMARLPEMAHLACIICHLKETPLKHVIGDFGVVHELIHLMHIPEESTVDLDRIRVVFNHVLELC